MRQTGFSTRSYFLCFILSALYLASSAHRAADPYDEGNLLTAGFQVSRGLLPYRDFWSMYAPLQALLLGAIQFVFGPELWAARVWDLLVKALLCSEAFAISALVAPLAAAGFAALLALLWLERAGLMLYPVFPALLCCLLALRLAVSPEDSSSKRRAAFAGVFSALAIGFRHDFLLYLGPALAWIACNSGTTLRKRWRRFALSGALPLLILALFLWSCGLERSYYCLLYFPSRIFSAVRTLAPASALSLLGLESWGEALLNPGKIQLSQALPLYFPFLALPLWLLRPRAHAITVAGARPLSHALTAALFCFGLLLLLQTRVRHDFAHVLPAYLPSFILLLAAAWPQIGRRSLGASCFLCAALTLMVPMLAIPLRSKAHALLASHAAPDPYPGREEAVQFIRAHTLATDRIFVALPRHDLLTRGDTALYFLSQRLPAAYWAELHPGEVDRPEIQEQLLAELEAQKLEFIVRAEPFPWEATALPAAVATALDTYLAQSYREVWRAGEYAVLQRVAA